MQHPATALRTAPGCCAPLQRHVGWQANRMSYSPSATSGCSVPIQQATQGKAQCTGRKPRGLKYYVVSGRQSEQGRSEEVKTSGASQQPSKQANHCSVPCHVTGTHKRSRWWADRLAWLSGPQMQARQRAPMPKAVTADLWQSCARRQTTNTTAVRQAVSRHMATQRLYNDSMQRSHNPHTLAKNSHLGQPVTVSAASA